MSMGCQSLAYIQRIYRSSVEVHSVFGNIICYACVVCSLQIARDLEGGKIEVRVVLEQLLTKKLLQHQGPDGNWEYAACLQNTSDAKRLLLCFLIERTYDAYHACNASSSHSIKTLRPCRFIWAGNELSTGQGGEGHVWEVTMFGPSTRRARWRGMPDILLFLPDNLLN